MNHKFVLLLLLLLVSLACGSFGTRPVATDSPEPPSQDVTIPPTLAPTATPTATPSPKPSLTASATTLEIVNNSNADILYVYLSPSFSDQWSGNLLKDNVIASGESFVLADIPFGTFDVMAETMDHIQIAAWFYQTFDGPMTWEIWGDGSGWIPRMDQWAFDASASTEYSFLEWSAQQATGDLNTYECGDHQTAWASAEPDGVDWLETRYMVPVIPGRINIRETNSPGFIERVEVVDETGHYHMVWEGEPALVDECPRVFSILVTGVDVPVVGVRIHLDQREGGNWNEIDAVELIGIEAVW